MQPYSSADCTDNELLDLIRIHNDQAAFAEIYRRYWKVLINAAGKRINSMEIAEEIVQDVFVSFYLRRKDIHVQSSLEAYLKTALKYQVFKIYRSQKIHRDHLDTIMNKQNIPPVTPDALLEASQLREQIWQVAEKMPEKCRQVFLMSRFEQLSHQDIADKLDISVGTVKKHITKAMSIMRTEFKDHQIDLFAVCLLVYLGR